MVPSPAAGHGVGGSIVDLIADFVFLYAWILTVWILRCPASTSRYSCIMCMWVSCDSHSGFVVFCSIQWLSCGLWSCTQWSSTMQRPRKATCSSSSAWSLLSEVQSFRWVIHYDSIMFFCDSLPALLLRTTDLKRNTPYLKANLLGIYFVLVFLLGMCICIGGK